MRNLFKIVLILVFGLSFNESKANTLFDSLNSAYQNNPKLNAERANMRASKEEKVVGQLRSDRNQWSSKSKIHVTLGRNVEMTSWC